MGHIQALADTHDHMTIDEHFTKAVAKLCDVLAKSLALPLCRTMQALLNS